MSRRIRFPHAYKNSATHVINMEHISEFRKSYYGTNDSDKPDLGEKAYNIYFTYSSKDIVYIIFWTEENRDEAYDLLCQYGVTDYGEPPFIEMTTRVHPSEVEKDE